MNDRLAAALSDRYRLESELGSGGMATVYLARDLKHDRPVALKVLRPELAHALGPERFVREIRVTARLEHPHILPLLDSGEANGFVYYAMPYVEGETLRERIAREGQLPLDDALQITRDVAGALAHAHRQGVVHRDVKPENILLATGYARLADFGIARACSAAGPALTETGLAVGTPAYMSPEQAGSGEEVDARSDVYALGCVLYEMLAGRPPFSGTSAREVLVRHAVEPPPSLTAARPAVPPDVERALTTALAKAPADRYATAAEFAAALTPAAGAARTRPTRRPIPRGGRLALAAAGVGIVLVATVLALRSPDAGRRPVAEAFPHTAIAVLPFGNLSPNGSDAYVAAGLHDEIVTELSKVAALRVTSRTSVLRFAERDRPLGEIARELQVGSVVEGTIQVAEGRLRVNVQLIDAATDGPLWGNQYDRTLDDVFAIQTDIAKRVVQAVGGVLSGSELSRMAASPTTSAEAYRVYLQARERFLRPTRLREDYEAALRLYERAVALDSGFALAHIGAAEIHALLHLFRWDASPERLSMAIAEFETAIRLAPELPQAHELAGLAYGYGRGDFPQALTWLYRAAAGMPSNARVWQRLGFVHRVLGAWDSAQAAFAKATDLDPHDADLFLHRGITEDLAHRYADAVRSQDRALALMPDFHAAAVARGWVYVRWQGQLDSLAAALHRVAGPGSSGPLGELAGHRLPLLLLRRDPDQLLRTIAAGAAPYEWELAFRPVELYAAWAHRLRGDEDAARTQFEAALAALDQRRARLPNDWRIVGARGLALAGLGRREEAMVELQQLGRSERSRVYPGGYLDLQLVEDRARILAQLGDADAALVEIERLLSRPSWVSVPLLRLDPLWDPIRSHPRFRELTAP